MKQIGLIGGTSWPSTLEYYRILNEMAQSFFGGHHSARLLVWNIDYHEIKSRYHHGWSEIPRLLKTEFEGLIHCKPGCIILCNNTLHEALDAFRPELDGTIPIFHMVDLVADRAVAQGKKSVLLLGTKYTMEHGYYTAKLEAKGLIVQVPKPADRELLQQMQSRISRGDNPPEFKAECRELLSRYNAVDAVITACTELPLVVTAEVTNLPILDPTLVQCEEAFRFACQK